MGNYRLIIASFMHFLFLFVFDTSAQPSDVSRAVSFKSFRCYFLPFLLFASNLLEVLEVWN